MKRLFLTTETDLKKSGTSFFTKITRQLNLIGVKFLKTLFLFCALTVISLLAAASIWECRVVGVLYRCSDSVPLLDFIPPFVHPGEVGDLYLVSESLVYRTWYTYLGVSLLLPIVLIFFMRCGCWRERKE